MTFSYYQLYPSGDTATELTAVESVSSFRLSCSLLSCDITGVSVVVVVSLVVVVVVSFPFLSSSPPPFEPVSEANADLRSTREILFERLPLVVDPP